MESFNSLIKTTETGYLRGVSLGISLDELKKIEGKKGNKKKGDSPHMLYKSEPSADEELFIYYGFNKKKKAVTDIRFLYHYYMAEQFERLGKSTDFLSFIHKENGLAELLVEPNKICTSFVQHFTKKFGAPKITKEDVRIYEKTNYEWEDHSPEKPVLIRITYYFYDEGPTPHDFRQVLQIVVDTI